MGVVKFLAPFVEGILNCSRHFHFALSVSLNCFKPLNHCNFKQYTIAIIKISKTDIKYIKFATETYQNFMNPHISLRKTEINECLNKRPLYV